MGSEQAGWLRRHERTGRALGSATSGGRARSHPAQEAARPKAQDQKRHEYGVPMTKGVERAFELRERLLWESDHLALLEGGREALGPVEVRGHRVTPRHDVVDIGREVVYAKVVCRMQRRTEFRSSPPWPRKR
jgi:hypothetical protein